MHTICTSTPVVMNIFEFHSLKKPEDIVCKIQGVAIIGKPFYNVAERIKIWYLNHAYLRLEQFSGTASFENSMKFICAYGTELKRLNFSRFRPLSFEDIGFMILKCPLLESLQLKFVNVANGISALKAAKNLKCLKIEACSLEDVPFQTEMDFHHFLIEQLPKVEKIHIDPFSPPLGYIDLGSNLCVEVVEKENHEQAFIYSRPDFADSP